MPSWQVLMKPSRAEVVSPSVSTPNASAGVLEQITPYSTVAQSALQPSLSSVLPSSQSSLISPSTPSPQTGSGRQMPRPEVNRTAQNCPEVQPSSRRHAFSQTRSSNVYEKQMPRNAS